MKQHLHNVPKYCLWLIAPSCHQLVVRSHWRKFHQRFFTVHISSSATIKLLNQIVPGKKPPKFFLASSDYARTHTVATLLHPNRCDQISPVLRQLHWLPVWQHVKVKLAMFIYVSPWGHIAISDWWLSTGRELQSSQAMVGWLTHTRAQWQELHYNWSMALERFASGTLSAVNLSHFGSC